MQAIFFLIRDIFKEWPQTFFQSSCFYSLLISFGLLTENKQVKEENQSVKKEGEGRVSQSKNQADY